MKFSAIVIVLMCRTLIYSFSGFIRIGLLTMFLLDGMGMSNRKSKIIVHSYKIPGDLLSPIAGYLGDTYIGSYRQIIIFHGITLALNVVWLLTSIPPVGIPPDPIAIITLVGMSIAGTTALVTIYPFVCDQFNLPAENELLSSFFIWDYWMANIGSTTGMLSGPFLREHVFCFGQPFCFALPFFIGVIFAFVAYLIVLVPMRMYTIKPPSKQSMVIKVIGIVKQAIVNSKTSEEKKEHWLDYANDKYDQHLIDDVKKLKMLYIMILWPMFFAMYSQEETAWIFQARNMTGDLGYFVILPDQMQNLNPILCVTLVPIFDKIIYPLLSKRNLLTTTLQRICTGGILMSLSYVIAGAVFLSIEAENPPMPEEWEGHLRLYNTMNCDMKIDVFGKQFEIKKLDFYSFTDVRVEVELNTPYNFTCGSTSNDGFFIIKEKALTGYYVRGREFVRFEDNIEKENRGLAKIRTLINSVETIEYTYEFGKRDVWLKSNSTDITDHHIYVGNFSLVIDDVPINEHKYTGGGVYTVLVTPLAGNKYETSILEITKPNTLCLLWQIPQYFTVVIGEILYAISMNEFCYTQAPKSLKALMQGILILAWTLGDVTIVIVETAIHFKRLSINAFCYAAVMFLDVLILIWLSIHYKYVHLEEDEPAEEEIK